MHKLEIRSKQRQNTAEQNYPDSVTSNDTTPGNSTQLSTQVYLKAVAERLKRYNAVQWTINS